MKKPRKFSTVANSAKTSFFRFSGEPVIGSGFYFSLKLSRDQDEDNDIRYSSIGSAVFELLSLKHTDRHTYIYHITLE